MAIEIPIWNGNPGTVVGNTPFGYYDGDPEFVHAAPRFAVWAAERLGYPIVDVELQDRNFYGAFENACAMYAQLVNAGNLSNNLMSIMGVSSATNLTQVLVPPSLDRVISLAKEYGSEVGAGGTISWRTGSLAVKAGKQRYDFVKYEGSSISGSLRSDIEIRQIYHYQIPASVRQYDQSIGSQGLLDQFGWNYQSNWSYLVTPLYYDTLKTQAIEFNDLMRRSAYSFKLVNNELTLLPLPESDFTLWFEYSHVSDRRDPARGGDLVTGSVSDISNARYDRIPYSSINQIGQQWIMQYALANVKETLGLIRKKYMSVPFANGRDIELNGDALLDQAANEREKLVEQLNELIEKTSAKTMMENKRDEANAQMEILKRFPMLPFMG